jgi:UDP-N-acetylglucosamine 2-epimerase (hydrolysing)
MKEILFVTGTRADYGKIKSLVRLTYESERYSVNLVVTGMHLLEEFGGTWREVDVIPSNQIHKISNQEIGDDMDQVLAKTICTVGDFIKRSKPDLVVVHGDRVETLAVAIVCSINNILVAHIEGGEISGTIDDLIRHATTKLSHIHFVTNSLSQNRLIKMGEDPNSIKVIGSPDLDSLFSKALPILTEVKSHYEINFEKYSICIFHPVTTEISQVRLQIDTLIQAILDSELNFVIIYPNNDAGSLEIISAYLKIKKNRKIRLIPSMRFEYYVTLLENADFIIGNSSSGLLESSILGTPTINIGSRQKNRFKIGTIVQSEINYEQIITSINIALNLGKKPIRNILVANSSNLFLKALDSKFLWKTQVQKTFFD